LIHLLTKGELVYVAIPKHGCYGRRSGRKADNAPPPASRKKRKKTRSRRVSLRA
jgi:hypothetical protein